MNKIYYGKNGGKYLVHYGIKGRSGRYPLGSGEEPYQDYGGKAPAFANLSEKDIKRVKDRIANLSEDDVERMKDSITNLSGEDFERVGEALANISEEDIERVGEILDEAKDMLMTDPRVKEMVTDLAHEAMKQTINAIGEIPIVNAVVTGVSSFVDNWKTGMSQIGHFFGNLFGGKKK